MPRQPADDQRGERCAFDVFRNDQQWPACLGDLFEPRGGSTRNVLTMIILAPRSL